MTGLLPANSGSDTEEKIMKFVLPLPSVVLSAIDSAILGDADSVDDDFDSLLDDNAAELAADKAAKLAKKDWSDLVTYIPEGGDV